MANGRCRMHGGKTVTAGPTSVTWKHGRYSKYLPGRMLERYTEALSDSELVALRDELSLLDSRLADLLGRVDSGESGRLWRQVADTYDKFRAAYADRDVPTAMEHLRDLDGLIARGQSDYAAWSEIQALIEQRRKLAESERKRLVDMQQMITSEQAMALVAALVDSVKRHVDDRDTLAAINADIIRLTRN